MDRKSSHVLVMLLLLFVVFQCGRTFYELPNVRIVPLQTSGTQPFEAIKARWTATFTIPDPLFKESDSNLPPFLTPPDLGLVRVTATLYGEEMITAWLKKTCQEDSISFKKAQEEYKDKYHPESKLRIELKLCSHFSEHSLDPHLWTIYLEDDGGVMYEPLSMQKGKVKVIEKEVYPPYGTFPLKIREITRTINLYFPQVTFFGKRLLSKETKFLRLVFSYQKRPVGEAKWILTPPKTANRSVKAP